MSWLKKHSIPITIHASVWVLLILISYGVTSEKNSPLTVYSVLGAHLFCYYFNSILLIEAFLKKGNKALYIASAILSIIFLTWAKTHYELVFLTHFLTSTKAIVPWAISLLTTSGTFALGTLIFMVNDNNAKTLQAALIQNEKTEMEMLFLKSQINPHFLLNTLNNLYSLVQLSSEKSSTAILKLSDLLRYVLYESDRELVPIAREIEAVKSYIFLEQLKSDYTLKINIDLDPDAGTHEIMPMLMIPLMENAFKHGNTHSDQDAVIRLRIVHMDNQLLITCSNTVNGTKSNSVGGIGNSNVKARLFNTYDSTAHFEVEQTELEYRVKIKVPIHDQVSHN